MFNIQFYSYFLIYSNLISWWVSFNHIQEQHQRFIAYCPAAKATRVLILLHRTMHKWSPPLLRRAIEPPLKNSEKRLMRHQAYANKPSTSRLRTIPPWMIRRGNFSAKGLAAERLASFRQTTTRLKVVLVFFFPAGAEWVRSGGIIYRGKREYSGNFQ